MKFVFGLLCLAAAVQAYDGASERTGYVGGRSGNTGYGNANINFGRNTKSATAGQSKTYDGSKTYTDDMAPNGYRGMTTAFGGQTRNFDAPSSNPSNSRSSSSFDTSAASRSLNNNGSPATTSDESIVYGAPPSNEERTSSTSENHGNSFVGNHNEEANSGKTMDYNMKNFGYGSFIPMSYSDIASMMNQNHRVPSMSYSGPSSMNTQNDGRPMSYSDPSSMNTQNDGRPMSYSGPLSMNSQNDGAIAKSTSDYNTDSRSAGFGSNEVTHENSGHNTGENQGYTGSFADKSAGNSDRTKVKLEEPSNNDNEENTSTPDSNSRGNSDAGLLETTKEHKDAQDFWKTVRNFKPSFHPWSTNFPAPYDVLEAVRNRAHPSSDAIMQIEYPGTGPGLNKIVPGYGCPGSACGNAAAWKYGNDESSFVHNLSRRNAANYQSTSAARIAAPPCPKSYIISCQPNLAPAPCSPATSSSSSNYGGNQATTAGYRATTNDSAARGAGGSGSYSGGMGGHSAYGGSAPSHSSNSYGGMSGGSSGYGGSSNSHSSGGNYGGRPASNGIHSTPASHCTPCGYGGSMGTSGSYGAHGSQSSAGNYGGGAGSYGGSSHGSSAHNGNAAAAPHRGSGGYAFSGAYSQPHPVFLNLQRIQLC